MKKGLCLLLCVLTAAIAAAAPLRLPMTPSPPAEEKKEKKLDLSGETHWGTIEQKGDALKIEGRLTQMGELWDAHGAILPDGKVTLLWRDRNTGDTAISVYQLRTDGERPFIFGVWAWPGEATINESGEMTGMAWYDNFQVWPKGQIPEDGPAEGDGPDL